MASGGEATHLRVLQAEIDKLQNAVSHLVQSNQELRAAIDEEGDDEDRTFKTAIEDNIVTIAKYRAQAERLERELSELRAGRHALGGEAIPAEEAAAPAAGSTGAAGGGGRQPAQPAADSGAAADTAMADAAEQQAAGQQAQQPGGGGMWM